ncbi:MAG: tetratricopeptide repeat protein [Candidatus Aminicenantes bacterium]|nr:tetratricopeptide repeat protein [Candidatus Aminicenantes bacterium]NIM79235.1 tetratricopeptide repeat protein [Candidatus Aminicenantes bacterium]NIN18513.1 tetratricopeptide repeat protein [Candidatus Aminicenantes bacterium]NIN42409.1 tetratricopeptide repeat protein [Candidatus Aminicenantes bacterium]NIN85176.1 tetratricopeptide repeat protein [Candidatus Aminicenantes bacterium]
MNKEMTPATPKSMQRLIFLLFFFSGISGLVYQLIWTRLLVLIFGNTMLATSTVLAAFMGGLAAGSFAAGKYIDKKPRPLVRLYALLEAGIGIFALLFPLLLKAIEPLYVNLYQGLNKNMAALNLTRFGICFALILVPTFLMGATLPVLLKRFVRGVHTIGSNVGILYGLNTIGAVIGTLVCGFLFLKMLGMQATTYVAVGINLAVAGAAWILGKADAAAKKPAPTPAPIKKEKRIPGQEYRKTTVITVFIGIGLSGFCALAYEVLWTRMLNLFFHNTVYSFTTILAVFLTGIALGSFIYSKFLAKINRKIVLFVVIEIGIGVIAYLTPFIFTSLYEALFSKATPALTVLKAAAIMIVPTILMGIALPLAVQICQRGPQREGDSVGSVYAVNTVGAIFGAFAAGFILAPNLGIHKSVIMVTSLNLLAGVLVLLTLVYIRRPIRWGYGFAFAAITAVLFLGASSPLFRSLYQKNQPGTDILLYKEGKIANVVVYDFYKDGYKDLYLNGIEEASSRLWHVQLFKMLGVLPAVVHHQPDNALMVAFGAGMSAGACSTQVSSLDCVELNPDIRQVADIFKHENLDIINNPKLDMITNDGRNFLLLTPKKYSLIISDATNPLTFDSWTLYTREFYQLCRDKLKPGGVFCQWVPIPLPGDSIKVILNTFKSVFPHTSFWVIYGSSQCLMLATPERLSIDYRELAEKLPPILKTSGLEEFGVDTVDKFLGFFHMGEKKLEEMLKGFNIINTDDLPYAQFHKGLDWQGIQAGLGLLKYQESIFPYLTNMGEQADQIKKSLENYLSISLMLSRGFLLGRDLEYKKASLLISRKKLPEDKNVTCMLKYDPLRKAYFLKRLGQGPDDANAYHALGSIYMKEGNYQEAIAYFKRAAALKPDFTNAYLNLARAYIGVSMFDRAVETLLKIRELNPAGRVLHAVNQELGIIHILRKLRYQKNDPLLYAALGRAYLEKGEFARAARVLAAAAELKPGDIEILGLLSGVYENLELVEESLAIYREMEKLLPEDAGIKEKIKQLTLVQTHPGARREWIFAKIPGKEPKKPDTGHPEGCDRAMDKWDDFESDGKIRPQNLLAAALEFEKVIDANKTHMHAYSDAAIIYEAMGEYRKAASLWERGLQVSPGNQRAVDNINRLGFLNELKWNRNLPRYRKIEIYNNIGVFHWKNREFDRAIQYFKKALDLNPQHVHSLANLGANYIETGKYIEALTVLELALKLNPNFAYAGPMKSRLQWLRSVVDANN